MLCLPSSDHRARIGAVDDRSERSLQLNEPIETVVRRNVLADQALEHKGAGCERLGVGRVHRGTALRVGARQVEPDAVSIDRQRRHQPHRLVREAVVVDDPFGREDALRQPRDVCSGPPLRVGDQLVDVAQNDVEPIPFDERSETAYAGRVRCHLRPEVSGRLVLGANLRQDQLEHVLHDGARLEGS